MKNKNLLSQIKAIQNTGNRVVKTIGFLLLNPISIGFLTYFLINNWGGSWLYMWVPSLIIMWLIYFVFSNFIVGLIIQTRSIKLYRKMTDSYEKENAYKIIKKSN